MMSDEQSSKSGRTNILGIVGFGLAFCLSPIGLLVSLAGLAKPPRGLAIAGVIIGLIGTVIWGFAAVAIWFGAPAVMQTTEVVTDFVQIRGAITRYQANNDGALPDDLSVLNLGPDVDTDPWGTAYRYELSGSNDWTLTVAGPDTTFDDELDAVLTSSMTNNEVGQMIGNTFGEQIIRDRLSNP